MTLLTRLRSSHRYVQPLGPFTARRPLTFGGQTFPWSSRTAARIPV